MDAPDHDLRKLLATYQDRSVSAAQPGMLDFCLMLLRQKHTFAVSLLASILLALAIGLFVPRLYESQAVIEIGSLGFARPVLESPEAVVERLRAEYDVGMRMFTVLSEPFVSDVTTSRHAKNYVTITTAGGDRDGARDLLYSVINRLIGEHRAVMQSGLTTARMQLRLATEQMARVRQNLVAIEGRLQHAVSGNRSTAVMALLADKHRLVEQLYEFEQLKVKAQAEITEAEARATKIIKAPTLPASPAGWSLPLYLLLGVIAGLVIGVVAAMAREFLSVLRARRDVLGDFR